jgi:hypothetical protein
VSPRPARVVYFCSDPTTPPRVTHSRPANSRHSYTSTRTRPRNRPPSPHNDRPNALNRAYLPRRNLPQTRADLIPYPSPPMLPANPSLHPLTNRIPSYNSAHVLSLTLSWISSRPVRGYRCRMRRARGDPVFNPWIWEVEGPDFRAPEWGRRSRRNPNPQPLGSQS